MRYFPFLVYGLLFTVWLAPVVFADVSDIPDYLKLLGLLGLLRLPGLLDYLKLLGLPGLLEPAAAYSKLEASYSTLTRGSSQP